jgi:hypothetical protein
MKEKRKFQRVPLKIECELQAGRKSLAKTFCKDISGGGFCLRLDTPLKKGERVKTFLYFSNNPKPVVVINKVAWCKKILIRNKQVFDVGFQNSKIAYKDRERFIFSFCEIMISYFLSRKS